MIVQERHMMNRLVRMIVISVPQEIRRRLVEHRIQIGNHPFRSSHQFHHTRNIVRHEPPLLQLIAFHTAVPFLQLTLFRPSLKPAIRFSRAEAMFLRII